MKTSSSGKHRDIWMVFCSVGSTQGPQETKDTQTVQSSKYQGKWFSFSACVLDKCPQRIKLEISNNLWLCYLHSLHFKDYSLYTNLDFFLKKSQPLKNGNANQLGQPWSMLQQVHFNKSCLILSREGTQAKASQLLQQRNWYYWSQNGHVDCSFRRLLATPHQRFPNAVE